MYIESILRRFIQLNQSCQAILGIPPTTHITFVFLSSLRAFELSRVYFE